MCAVSILAKSGLNWARVRRRVACSNEWKSEKYVFGYNSKGEFFAINTNIAYLLIESFLCSCLTVWMVDYYYVQIVDKCWKDTSECYVFVDSFLFRHTLRRWTHKIALNPEWFIDHGKNVPWVEIRNTCNWQGMANARPEFDRQEDGGWEWTRRRGLLYQLLDSYLCSFSLVRYLPPITEWRRNSHGQTTRKVSS